MPQVREKGLQELEVGTQERDRVPASPPTLYHFATSDSVKNPPAMPEMWVRLIPGLERSPGEGNG